MLLSENFCCRKGDPTSGRRGDGWMGLLHKTNWLRCQIFLHYIIIFKMLMTRGWWSSTPLARPPNPRFIHPLSLFKNRDTHTHTHTHRTHAPEPRFDTVSGFHRLSQLPFIITADSTQRVNSPMLLLLLWLADQYVWRLGPSARVTDQNKHWVGVFFCCYCCHR